MACFKPSRMYECVNSVGEVFYSFRPGSKAIIIREFPIKCGQCSGCRTSYSRMWAIRCCHEALMHDVNCFITLTVEDKYKELVFPKGSLSYVFFQKFLRSLRKKIGKRVRFFMCGEYGPKFDRPHYHAIIFGWYPESSDRKLLKQTPAGTFYTSEVLASCWKFGYHSVGGFDFGSAFYVAGYIQKKINGRLKERWYQGRCPEFAKCSLKPGIGEAFYKKFTSDLYRKDLVTLPGGQKYQVPRYYDKLHAYYHPNSMQKIKLKREAPDPIRDLRNAPERLAARKVILEQKLLRQQRALDSGGAS